MVIYLLVSIFLLTMLWTLRQQCFGLALGSALDIALGSALVFFTKAIQL